jgi:hypothetical protein
MPQYEIAIWPRARPDNGASRKFFGRFGGIARIS